MAKGIKELSKEFKEAKSAVETKESAKTAVESKPKEMEEVLEKTFEEQYGIPEFEHGHDYKFTLCNTNVNLKNQSISNRCVIFDTVLGRERVIRYIPTEETIFEDEQVFIDAQTGEQKVGEISEYTIGITNGMLHTSDDRMLYLFLYMHGRREGTPFVRRGPRAKTNPIFRYIDEIKIAQDARKRQDVELKAFMLADKATHDEMMQHAYVLGVNTSLHESQIKYAYITKARENPEFFLRSFNDPKNKRIWVIMKGFEQNIITDKNPPMEVRWVGSGTKICDIPAGESAKDYLTSWSFSEQGNDFVSTLMKMVV